MVTKVAVPLLKESQISTVAPAVAAWPLSVGVPVLMVLSPSKPLSAMLGKGVLPALRVKVGPVVAPVLPKKP